MEQYGGAKKPKKTSTTKSKKVPTSSSSKTIKTRSKVKGGNFIGAVGDLVAPTGWGPFATTAGLFALDRADAALRRDKSNKSSEKKGGSSKTSSKSKKGGNFLGSVSELFVPTGWENFATAAGLLAIDRADAAFRRGRNSSKKQKGGADLDGHESIENMEQMMESMTDGSDSIMSGGAKKKTTKKTTKKSTAKKTTKKTTKKPAKKAKKSSK